MEFITAYVFKDVETDSVSQELIYLWPGWVIWAGALLDGSPQKLIRLFALKQKDLIRIISLWGMHILFLKSKGFYN